MSGSAGAVDEANGLGRRLLLGSGLAVLAAPALAQQPGAFLTYAGDTLAPGLRHDVLIRWGDRVEFDAPPFDPARLTAEAARPQFGWDGRIIGLVEPPSAPGSPPRAVLVVAHPTVDPSMVSPSGQLRADVALALQGASVLNMEWQGNRWMLRDGGFQTRRLHGRTLCRVTGPGRERLGDGVQGIVGARGGCTTPWRSALLAEDATIGRGEAFGWVVEFDPLDPQSVPAKRTALGRFARGDAAATLTQDGRAVVYMTDRRRGGFLFRFVSEGPAGDGALDAGQLSVAAIQGETLRWAPVADPAAAAASGGTALDMPAGLAVGARAPRLFLTTLGGAGQVIEIIANAGDHGAETAIVRGVLSGRAAPPLPDPNSRMRPPEVTPWPEAPATLASDGQGALFLGTDRDGRVTALPDALFRLDVGNGQVARPTPLYGVPRGAGLGGAVLTPDRRALLVMVRRPGAERGASFANPTTGWPEFIPGMPPRSAVVVLMREDGRGF